MEWLSICLGFLFLLGSIAAGADDMALLYPDNMRSPRSVTRSGGSGSGNSGSGNSDLEPVDPFPTGSGSPGPIPGHDSSISRPGNGELVRVCGARMTDWLLFPDTGTQDCSSPCSRDMCASVSSFISEGPNTQSCRCDRYCSFFRDCCEGTECAAADCSINGAYSDRSLWACHSLYISGTVSLPQFSPLQVGVYVVSECPSTWPALSQTLGLSVAEFGMVRELCNAVNSTLPFVSDVLSGRVYRNEYCALCHEVSRISLWHQSVFCSNAIQDAIREESLLTVATVRQWCNPCVHNSPPALYINQTEELPRSCTPALSSCPNYHEAMQRAAMNQSMSLLDYQQIVTNCTEHVEYVLASSDRYAGEDVVYKNPHCVMCNTLTPAYRCFSYNSSQFPFCKSQPNSKWNGSGVEVVLDAAMQTVQVLSNMDPVYRNVSLDVKCPFGQVFSFASFECREVSCFQFDLASSNFTCVVTGLRGGADKSAECSEELVIDYSFFFFSLDKSKTMYYYFPLRSVVIVNYTNAVGSQVACLDNTIPSELNIVKALNILTFSVTVPSILIMGSLSFMCIIPMCLDTVYGLVMANFTLTLLLGDLAVLLGYAIVNLTWSKKLCYSSGILDHYFALCQFFWVLVLTFNVGIRYYRQAKSSLHRLSLRALLVCYGTGWFFPFIVTSFEVAVTFALDIKTEGRSTSCFQFSTLFISFLAYLLPSLAAIAGSFVALPVLLHLACSNGLAMTAKDKAHFAVLFFLLPILSADFLLRAATLFVWSNYVDVVVGFCRLSVIALRSIYLASVLLLEKKVFLAICSFFQPSKSKVGTATAEQIELAERRLGGVALVGLTRENTELNLLADQLANPSGTR